MDPSESSLIARFKDGDESAFEQIVLACQDRIYNLCRHMLGNLRDAEDASQDVFVKAYRGLRSFEPDASFSSWLYRVAVNTCIDYKRKPVAESFLRTSGEGAEFTLEPMSNLPSPEDSYESKELGETIQRGLDRMPKKLKAVIVLREIEGLSYEEIARILDISVGTVKSRISRARDELRESLRGLTRANLQAPHKLSNKKQV